MSSMSCDMELEEGWIVMQKGINKVTSLLEGFPGEQDSKEYSMLYKTIYNLCCDKSPAEVTRNSQYLYDRYKASFEGYITKMVLPQLRGKHGEFLLKEFTKRWDNHKIMMRWLSHFFMYLDRFFIRKLELPTLKEVGLMSFETQVYEEMKNNVRDAVLKLIDREREGEKVDVALLKNVLAIFVEMGLGSIVAYMRDFDGALLTNTSAYYSRKASSWIGESSCPEYMLKAEQCLKNESERAKRYLNAISEPNLLETVQQEMLVQYEIQLLEKEKSGLYALLRDNMIEDISRMYRLFCKIPNGLEPLATILKQQVIDEGENLVKQAEHEASNEKVRKKENAFEGQGQILLLADNLIRRIINLHDKFSMYLRECFANHSVLHKAVKEGFEAFCNKVVAGRTTPELLATFCDDLLRGGNNRLNDASFEETLQKGVSLISYINDKDLFAEFYRNKLSRRLLLHKRLNDDLEQNILAKLKQQCGAQFTFKMDSMVIDMILARDQATFQDYCKKELASKLGIELAVQVLNTAAWPTYRSSDLVLPVEMANSMEVFKEFYQTKTKQRKLSWTYSVGTCIIDGTFGTETFELVMIPYQAAVLLLFNGSETLSYADVKEQLNLAEEDVLRLLYSLSCAKHKILTKDPSTKTCTTSDSFAINTGFSAQTRRVKISCPPMNEKKKVIEHVDTDRLHAIDASIVRIMKSRTVLHYQQLLDECLDHLGGKFKPDVKDIKKRIDHLIGREFLERDREDPNMFKYVG